MNPIERQTILITGATDGHGRGVAQALARRGATVLVHGRDAGRIDACVEELARLGAANARGYRADLASLADVRALADEVTAKESRLDALVNNAGVGTRVPGDGERMVSHDGHELRFAVNYLAHDLLTRRLLPLLRASAPARIVNVSSAGQAPVDFADVMLERRYDGTTAYCRSKLAQILSTVTFAEQLRDAGVTVNALHPATFMPTKLVATPASSLASGVEATLRLLVDPDLEHVTGRYFDGQREAKADRQAYDGDARRKLWALSEKLLASYL